MTTPGMSASGPHPHSRWGEGAHIVCDGLVKIYKTSDLEVVALQGLDLLVERGEMMAIIGASGSGKSTLLAILAGVDVPTAGRAEVAGRDLGSMADRDRAVYRRHVVGFVWQQTSRNLLPYLTAAENVELPMVLDNRPGRRQRALDLLEMVGLADRAGHRPAAMSGGEQQRVAIAVALANAPEVLLADEPTGELDTQTSDEVFSVLREVNASFGTTIVIVTHDPVVSQHVRRTVRIRDGRTSTETIHRHGPTGSFPVSEEFVVLDRAGRLQLPRSHVDALGLRHRVRVRLEGDRIEIRPDGDAPGADVPADGEPGAEREGRPGDGAA
jgi:ABC-type lipoprotein export system ATPase subunit